MTKLRKRRIKNAWNKSWKVYPSILEPWKFWERQEAWNKCSCKIKTFLTELHSSTFTLSSSKLLDLRVFVEPWRVFQQLLIYVRTKLRNQHQRRQWENIFLTFCHCKCWNVLENILEVNRMISCCEL